MDKILFELYNLYYPLDNCHLQVKKAWVVVLNLKIHILVI